MIRFNTTDETDPTSARRPRLTDDKNNHLGTESPAAVQPQKYKHQEYISQ